MIERNIAARKAFTDRIKQRSKCKTIPRDYVQGGHVRSQDEVIAAMAPDVQREPFKPGGPAYIMCRDICGLVFAERGEDEGNALLSRYGVNRVADLLPSTYNDFHQYATIILTRGLSPMDTNWSINPPNYPEQLRDRWLLAHHESDCLWEVRGKLSATDKTALASGEVEDVSGSPAWEARYLAEMSCQQSI